MTNERIKFVTGAAIAAPAEHAPEVVFAEITFTLSAENTDPIIIDDGVTQFLQSVGKAEKLHLGLHATYPHKGSFSIQTYYSESRRSQTYYYEPDQRDETLSEISQVILKYFGEHMTDECKAQLDDIIENRLTAFAFGLPARGVSPAGTEQPLAPQEAARNA